MKILPKIKNMTISSNESNIKLCINESTIIDYINSNTETVEIVNDLIEHKAFATTLLYLNEKSKLEIKKDSLINESNINDFYKECEELLNKNIKIVKEKGPLLTSIDGYPIYEVEDGILRGAGESKVKESFKISDEEDLAWDLVDFTRDYDTYDFNDKYNSEEDAANQYMKDLTSTSGIEDITAWLNSIKEEGDESAFSLEALESILARLDILKSKLNESEEDLGNKIRDIINNNWNNGYAKTNAISAIYYLIHDGKDEPVFPEDEKDMKKAEELYDKYSKQILSEEGTQTSDIAGKVDQDLGINKPKIITSKINGLDESISLRGFLRNEKGEYVRGNYILCMEGSKYIAKRIDSLNEDISGNSALNNISNIQTAIQTNTGCSVNVEKDGNKLIFHIKGNSSQLLKAMDYGDELSKLFKGLGNTVELSTASNEFIYTIY